MGVNFDQEGKLRKKLQATGSDSLEEALSRLLEVREEQDRWLMLNREAVDAKIRLAVEQLDGGAGTLGDEAFARLQARKAAWLCKHANTEQ